MEQGHAPAAPRSEVVAEQRAAPAEHEGAVRGQVGARHTALQPEQGARDAEGKEHVSQPRDPHVGPAAVQPRALERELGVQIAPHGESFAAASQGQLDEIDARRGERRVGAERPRTHGRLGPHRQRVRSLPRNARAPFPTRPEPVPVRDAGARREIVVEQTLAPLV